MKAELVSIGTELLLGHITDTNAPLLAQSLSSLGIDLYWTSGVGDNLGRVVDVLRRAWDRSDLVICTGGVGPTEDDLTRESISTLLCEEMRVDRTLAEDLRGYFRRRGAEMPERNIKQATLIPSAQPLRNPIGTAPGWWVEKDGRVIVCMPGVPVEMEKMWNEQVLPRLAQRQGAAVILTRLLKVLGKGESATEEMLQPLLASTNPTIATYAKRDGVHVRVTAKAANGAEAEGMVAEMEARVREILGSYIYGTDNQTLPEVTGSLLLAQGLTVATMEAWSGGVLSTMLSDDPRAGEFFKGGLVAPGAASLRDWGVPESLATPDGLATPESAAAMASAARQRTGADIGLAISGNPGPVDLGGFRGGFANVASDRCGQVEMVTARYRTQASEVKRLATLTAINLVRIQLMGDDPQRARPY